MSLSRIPLRPTRPFAMLLIESRWASAAMPSEPRHDVSKPAQESGYIEYARNWSRDTDYDAKYAPQHRNTMFRYLISSLRRSYEVYPLVFLAGAWVVVVAYVVLISFRKLEIWLDHSSSQPWDWEKIRTDYWKKPTQAIDPEGVTHQRLPIMEVLEDEMLEAAKQRGTRP